MHIDGLDHIAFAVPDQEASIAWYRSVLGLDRAYEEAWGMGPAVVVAPDGTGVALFRANDRRRPGFLHFAFRLDAAGLAAARERLVGAGMAFVEDDHKVSRSIYFADPDGIQIELTTYEV